AKSARAAQSGPCGTSGCCSGSSALTRLEARIALADHEDLAATTDDLAVAVAALGRLERGENFHDDEPWKSCTQLTRKNSPTATVAQVSAAPLLPAGAFDAPFRLMQRRCSPPPACGGRPGWGNFPVRGKSARQ